MKDEYEGLTIAFPDTRITSAPLGYMVESVFRWAEQGEEFTTILDQLENQIQKTSAFIMVQPFWGISLVSSQSYTSMTRV